MRPQAPSDVAAPSAEVGEAIGEYRLVQVLGHGAMGMVYRAHDPRLDRFVALKLVHPERIAKDPAKARARLVAEARALARVSHPNVVAVYDVGVHDELVFVALELIDGIDLAQWLHARPRPWSEVVAVFSEAAAGLTAVHAAGLVHRDVKPANILVEHGKRGRAFGRVLAADFGIARATAAVTPLQLQEREGQGDNAGCWTVYNLQISGEYYVADDVLTLHPTTTHLFVDECGTVTVSEDVHPDAVFWFQRSADEYGQTLILTPQDGSAVLEYHLL